MRNNHRSHHSCETRRFDNAKHDGSLSDLLARCGHYHAHRIGSNHRSQDSVLAWLASNPDATQKELAEGLGIMPASLSEVLMKLERKGYIIRFKDENDRRFSRVRLTDEGKSALDTTDECMPEDPFTALSPEEQEVLKQLLNKLLTDWESRYAYERKRQGRKQFSERGHEHLNHDNDQHNHSGERTCHADEPHNHQLDANGCRADKDSEHHGHGHH